MFELHVNPNGLYPKGAPTSRQPASEACLHQSILIPQSVQVHQDRQAKSNLKVKTSFEKRFGLEEEGSQVV
jgi:hypothetical protein